MGLFESFQVLGVGTVLSGHQQVTGGGGPTLKDTLIQPMEAALNQPTFLTQAQALLGRAISEHTTQRNAEVKRIVPIPAVAAASVSHSAAVGGSVVGVVGLL